MLKLSPSYFQGIEFIQLCQLPFDQARKLRNWLSDIDVFKVENEYEKYEGCVHYDDYEFWFDTNQVDSTDAYELL